MERKVGGYTVEYYGRRCQISRKAPDDKARASCAGRYPVKKRYKEMYLYNNIAFHA